MASKISALFGCPKNIQKHQQMHFTEVLEASVEKKCILFEPLVDFEGFGTDRVLIACFILPPVSELLPTSVCDLGARLLFFCHLVFQPKSMDSSRG